MKTKKPLIQLKDIQKSYKNGDVITPILNGITFTLYEGDFTAITGPSGSGKSTLMNIIGLLDIPTKGDYVLNGAKTTGLKEDQLSRLRNREIGFVFQSFNLLPRATALENVVLPAVYKGVSRREREIHAKKLLDMLGLKERMLYKPNQLSGGQQQRVAIARALMNNPSILLADEPTGNLDTKSGEEVMKIFTNLNKEGKTIVLITHEHDVAQKAKKIIHIRDGLLVK